MILVKTLVGKLKITAFLLSYTFTEEVIGFRM